MTQIRTEVEKVSFGTFGAPSDPSGPNFHMREWWLMVLKHNMNRFRPFPAKSNDSNWIRSPKSMFLHIFFRFLLSVGVKKEPKKISKNFIAFSCLE